MLRKNRGTLQIGFGGSIGLGKGAEGEIGLTISLSDGLSLYASGGLLGTTPLWKKRKQ